MSATPSTAPSAAPYAEPPAIEAAGLVVRYGSVVAVDGLDLRVGAGECTALVGRNGAGKSTTLRALAGVAPVTAGAVRLLGIEAARDPQRARAAVGYCPDIGGLIPRATAWEHFELAARLRGATGWTGEARELLERFDLASAADRITAGFSHGMMRRLSVALAGFGRPPVLLLDEPFDGVDPLGADATLELVAAARAGGAAVVVSTHLLPLAVAAADGVVVMRAGRAVAHTDGRSLAGDTGAERYRRLLA